MANVMHRIRAEWSGIKGAPGVSTFYQVGNQDATLEPIAAFFTALKASLPAGLTITIKPDGDTISDTDGTLQGAWGRPTIAPIVMTGNALFSGPVGAAVTWRTETFAPGGTLVRPTQRRLKGRTFIVPVGDGAYANGGGITASFQNTLQTAARAMVTAAPNRFMVWSRPLIDPETKAILRPGTSGPITNADVSQKAMVLRSRRD